MIEVKRNVKFNVLEILVLLNLLNYNLLLENLVILIVVQSFGTCW